MSKMLNMYEQMWSSFASGGPVLSLVFFDKCCRKTGPNRYWLGKVNRGRRWAKCWIFTSKCGRVLPAKCSEPSAPGQGVQMTPPCANHFFDLQIKTLICTNDSQTLDIYEQRPLGAWNRAPKPLEAWNRALEPLEAWSRVLKHFQAWNRGWNFWRLEIEPCGFSRVFFVKLDFVVFFRQTLGHPPNPWTLGHPESESSNTMPARVQIVEPYAM